MDTIIHHISTFITVYCTNNINTGDRIIDNVIVAILSIISIKIIKDLCHNWRDNYNCLIFHLYGMKNNPLELWRAPYSYNFDCTSKEDFFSSHKAYSINCVLLEHNELYPRWSLYADKILGPLIRKNKITRLSNKDGSRLVCSNSTWWTEFTIENNDYGLYIIAIDPYGCPIYYGTNGGLYFKNRNGYLQIEKHLKIYCNQEYENIKNVVNTSSCIYVMKFGNSDTRGNIIHKLEKIGDISSKKTFDTLFYTQKDELINILEKFKNGNMYPEHIPIDNKLGIILYGPPGTGKTGTISAIANYLKRNITIVNLTDISTTEQLEKILDPARYKETIFVLDEFDCILDVLGKNIQQDKMDKSDWSSILMVAEGDERKQILEMMKSGKKADKQNVNMAYLLQKLDGLESADGRIIIATTNNPDKINPALLRPGRFDLKLCLGNCNIDMYYKILQTFYKNEKDVYKRVIKANIPEYKYSPLELMNLAMKENSLNKLLKKLSTNSSN